jgi:hypothetical protein
MATEPSQDQLDAIARECRCSAYRLWVIGNRRVELRVRPEVRALPPTPEQMQCLRAEIAKIPGWTLATRNED